jgi:tetratricopeptide (TPR) repeat protein
VAGKISKLAWCMIVKPTDEESVLLDRCLGYLDGYVDKFFITITGDNEKCDAVAKKYKSDISHIDWKNDFAEARNFNFSQVPPEYSFLGWCDTDDILKGAEHLPKVVEKMKEQAADCGVMFYLYDFKDGECTVKHLKTRIVKNDGCVKWEGRVHEDFINTREIESYFIKEIEVLHLADEKRSKASAERNLDIAKEALKDNPDARSYYLMANAEWGMGRPDKTVEWFKKFVKVSGSDEEKYQAYLTLGELDENRDYYFKAMELRPTYPNAYFQLGDSLRKDRRFEQALNFFEIGLQLPKPDMTKIVHNPRDFDYNPLMQMMDIYLETGEYQKAMKILDELKRLFPKDKEIVQKARVFNEVFEITKKVEKATSDILQIKDKKKLRKYFDKMEPSVRQHPKMCAAHNANFVKEESSGKDLVFYCSYTSKVWNPDVAMKDGIGGSEEAVINLAKGLKDYNVTVYNNCGEAKVYDGVQYRPFWEWNPKDKQDITIIWRHPKPLDIPINSTKIFIDLHDVLPKEEFTPERLAKIDKIFVKSKAHRGLFPNVPDEKIVVIPNGVDSSQFEKKVQKNQCVILNTSSPDRHLDATLDIFEELIRRQPDKPWKLAWYYGWSVYDGVQEDNPEMMKWKDDMMARFNTLVAEGRAEGGYMINHREIAKKYLEAGIFLYPTQFFEIHCISAVKAQLAGCKCITSDFAALNETVEYGRKIHTDGKRWKDKENTFGDSENKEAYLDAILLSGYARYQKGSESWAEETYNWDNIVSQWQKLLEI